MLVLRGVFSYSKCQGSLLEGSWGAGGFVPPTLGDYTSILTPQISKESQNFSDVWKKNHGGPPQKTWPISF